MITLLLLASCHSANRWRDLDTECTSTGSDVVVQADEPTELGVSASQALTVLVSTPVPALGNLGSLELSVTAEPSDPAYVGERARSDGGKYPQLDPPDLFCILGKSLHVPVLWTVGSDAFGSCTGPALLVAQGSDRTGIWVGTPADEPNVCTPGPVMTEWAESLNGCGDPWFELQQVGRPDLPWSEGVSGFLLANCADGGSAGVTFGDVAGEYEPGEHPPSE